MTTYTLSGFGNHSVGGTRTAVISDAEMTIIAPDGAGFSYSIIDTTNPIPQILLSLDSYSLSFDGHPMDPANVETFIGTLTWSGGTTTILNVVVHTSSNTDDIYLFRIDGAAFPPVNSLAELSALEQSVTSIATPTGAFGPGTHIAFDQLAATGITENDRIFGGASSDDLSGGKGKDRISGGSGNDNLDGGAGQDRLYGGKDGDTLVGGGGNDRLFGNGGKDHLIGGKGDDLLSGGNGADRFIFANGFGNDTITDFDAVAKGEQIDLSGVTRIRHFNDLSKNHMDQVGDDVVISDGRGNTITLLDTSLGDLDKSDFLF